MFSASLNQSFIHMFAPNLFGKLLSSLVCTCSLRMLSAHSYPVLGRDMLVPNVSSRLSTSLVFTCWLRVFLANSPPVL